MVANSVKATSYMYLSSNAAVKTQNKTQNDFASVMEKAGENQQSTSAQNTQKSSNANSKTDTSRKVSKEEPTKDASVQENKTQSTETSETKPAENENISADTVKTENESEVKTDDVMDADDITKAAENLVQFPVQNERETIFDNIENEMTDIAKDGQWQITKQVVDRLTESLQVSADDIQASMENLDMNISDLQNPQNLLKLIVDVKDLKGPEELLTVAGLSETFKELSTELKDILKDLQEPSYQEYDSSISKEQLSVNTEISQAMTESNGRETDSREEKASDSSKHVFSSNFMQDNSAGNSILAQQVNFNDRVQELLAERMDVQTSESIVKQVLEQVKLNIKTDVTSVQMQLYPEHLGKVAIQIVSKNGMLTAQIATENESARAALESQLNTLKESFDNQGLKVESVEVMVSSRGFEQNTDTNSGSSENQKQGRRIRKSILEELNGQEEEPEEEDLKSTLGNTVSYTA